MSVLNAHMQIDCQEIEEKNSLGSPEFCSFYSGIFLFLIVVAYFAL